MNYSVTARPVQNMQPLQVHAQQYPSADIAATDALSRTVHFLALADAVGRPASSN